MAMRARRTGRRLPRWGLVGSASLLVVLVGASASAQVRPPAAQSPGAPAAAPTTAPAPAGSAGQVAVTPAAPQATAQPAAGPSPTHGEILRAYHEALGRRRLGSQEQLTGDDVHDRLAEVEDLQRAGRIDEAIARMAEIVEHPRFEPYVDTEDGRAAVWLLGDALASAGAYEPARAYLRRLVAQPSAWVAPAAFARRAVRRLVEIGVEADDAKTAVADLAGVPATAPDETRGDVAYITGRAKRGRGRPRRRHGRIRLGGPELALLVAGDVPPRPHPRRATALEGGGGRSSARSPTRTVATGRAPSSPTSTTSPSATSPGSPSGAWRTSSTASTTRATITTSSRATRTASPRRSTKRRPRATRRRTTTARASSSTS